MMFVEHDSFLLTRSIEKAIPAGTVGVVLMGFGGDPPSYIVEFPDGEGGNLGSEITFTISEDDMKPVERSP